MKSNAKSGNKSQESRGSKTKLSKTKVQISCKNQPKISSFFKSENESNAPSGVTIQPTAKISRPVSRLKPQPTSIGSQEQIVIELSDSETEPECAEFMPSASASSSEEKIESPTNGEVNWSPTDYCEIEMEEEETSSYFGGCDSETDHISEAVIASIPSTSNGAKNADGDDNIGVTGTGIDMTSKISTDVSFDDDSGDELLSQVDIEEVISSQEKQSKHEQSTPTSEETPSTPPPLQRENVQMPHSTSRTPLKSPKSKINFQSPIRSLNKYRRSRSRSSSSSNSQSPKGSALFRTPSSGSLSQSSVRPSADVRSSQRTSTSPSVVKKLQFPDTESSAPSSRFEPYYLANFQQVVNSVVQDSHYTYLFTPEDLEIVEKFGNFSYAAKCLYVRLFQRKWNWKAASSIKYPKIKECLDNIFEELHHAGFLIEIKDERPNLDVVLDLLKGDQIAALGKQMRINPSKKTKETYITALMEISRNQSTLLGSSSDVIYKGALKLLGPTYLVEGTAKDLFSRMFILYSPPQYWEDEQDQTSNQLLKILMTDIGQMKYPVYSINKSIKIHKDRAELIRFHQAWALHCEITAHLESKNWEDVIHIGEQSLTQLKEILEDSEIQSSDQSLPGFLRVYTAGSVLARVSWLAVDGEQKLKNFSKANSTIEFLLQQEVYLTQYRGRWYERLVINQKHLKESNNAIKLSLEAALQDNFIQEYHKLSLSERLEKLVNEVKKPPRKRSKKTANEESEDIIEEGITEVNLFKLQNSLPTRQIQGEKLFNPNSGKSVFISKQDTSGSSKASSVELFAVEFYKTIGYTYGLHAEGAVVISIFGLLFWDEIYTDQITDTFHSKYQAFPLDLNFDDFFKRREKSIIDKLNQIRSIWTIDETLTIIESNWNAYFETLSIVNWSVFPSVEGIKSLVKAMGLPITTSICERLAKNFRQYRSGFPDLVVWNEKDFIFVEVKGPGDTLSSKQKVWIDFLVSVGAKAEVCHVEAVSNKRIVVSK